METMEQLTRRTSFKVYEYIHGDRLLLGEFSQVSEAMLYSQMRDEVMETPTIVIAPQWYIERMKMKWFSDSSVWGLDGDEVYMKKG